MDGGLARSARPQSRAAAIPIGLGMILHGVGLVGGIIASAIAVKPPPPLKLRSQPVAAQSPPPGVTL